MSALIQRCENLVISHVGHVQSPTIVLMVGILACVRFGSCDMRVTFHYVKFCVNARTIVLHDICSSFLTYASLFLPEVNVTYI